MTKRSSRVQSRDWRRWLSLDAAGLAENRQPIGGPLESFKQG